MVVDVVGILNLDWDALVAPSTEPAVEVPVLDRFTPAAVLSEIGISKRFAGKALTEKVEQLIMAAGRSDDSHYLKVNDLNLCFELNS